MFTVPKTKGSAAGIELSTRVVAAFERQAARQAVERTEWADCYENHDLVFARDSLKLAPQPVERLHRGRR
jgi:hypothetical protein